MTAIDVNSPEERSRVASITKGYATGGAVYARDVADWCARSLAEAKDTGAFDTRCFVQNADLIIAALREYATPRDEVFCTNGSDFVAIRRVPGTKPPQPGTVAR